MMPKIDENYSEVKEGSHGRRQKDFKILSFQEDKENSKMYQT